MLSRVLIRTNVVLVLALLIFPIAAFTQELKCSRVPDSCSASTPRAQWNDLPMYTLSCGPGFTIRNAEDIAAKVAIGWNTSYFFVVAFVSDDIFCPSDSATNFWRGDSIQFAIKPKSGDAFFLGAADLPFGRRVIPTSVPDGYPQDSWNVPFEVIRDGSKMTYVVALPWRYLGNMNPLSDGDFKFNVIVNDNDGGGRRGWLQLSDGIGDSPDATKFPSAVFEQSPAPVPEIHVFAGAPKVEVWQKLHLSISTRDAEPGMRIKVTAGRNSREIAANAGSTSVDFDGGSFGVGDLLVRADLVEADGKLLSSSETGVLVFDSKQQTDLLKDAAATLAQANDLIGQARQKKYVVDYIQIRANCLRHALDVADMAQRGYTKADGIKVNFGGIRERGIRYAQTAAPALLADARKLAHGEPDAGFTVPRPDLSQPWTVRGGNLYAGKSPIILNGMIWTYNAKDTSYPLDDFGFNTQAFETGPSCVTNASFKLDDNIRANDQISSIRSSLLLARKTNEAADMLLSPHYIPGWFAEIERRLGEADNECGWMDTDEGRRLLDLSYQGIARAYDDQTIKTVDIANEWVFYSTSARSMAKFQEWLASNYKSISKLNEIWHSDYKTFSDVPAPFTGTRAMFPEGIYRNRAPYWDWCTFNTQRAATVLAWMNRDVKKNFPGKFTHIKCILSSKENRTFAQNFILGIDPQQTLPITDLIGTDGSYIVSDMWKGTLLAYDYMKSICPSKPIVCSEMHAMPYGDRTASEVRRGLFQRVIHGERQNTLYLSTKLQAPEWWTEGENDSGFNINQAPDVFESFALTSADFRRLAPELFEFANRQPSIGLFYDNSADFGVPGSDTPPGEYNNRLLKVYESLLPMDAKVGVVTESMLAKDRPKYRLVVFASAQFVSDRTVSALKDYVRHGGKLLLIGDNFEFDQHGQRRSAVNLGSRNVIRVPLEDSAAKYARMWPRVFGLARLRPPFAISGRDGKQIGDVELLSAKDAQGQPLVFVANGNSSDVSCVLQDAGGFKVRFKDLISGKLFDGADLKLQRDQVVLLRTERAGR